jgi:hypothetical protein
MWRVSAAHAVFQLRDCASRSRRPHNPVGHRSWTISRRPSCARACTTRWSNAPTANAPTSIPSASIPTPRFDSCWLAGPWQGRNCTSWMNETRLGAPAAKRHDEPATGLLSTPNPGSSYPCRDCRTRGSNFQLVRRRMCSGEPGALIAHAGFRPGGGEVTPHPYRT